MKNRIFLALLLSLNIAVASVFCSESPKAAQSYAKLNENTANPFVVSIGTSRSQTGDSESTAHPDYIRQQLQTLAKKNDNPRNYLSHPDRIGYVLKVLPVISCSHCHQQTNPAKLTEQTLIDGLLDNVAENKDANKLTITKCPHCHNTSIVEQPRKQNILTPAHQQAMIDQLTCLGVKNQPACATQGLPSYRISLEACDVLAQNSCKVDPKKLQDQAHFLQKLGNGNSIIFAHHYANPQSKPNLFENKEDAEWFANYCAQLIAASPQITHACPISQPVAFCHRVTRGTLPPFTCSVSKDEYLENITQAQVLACKKMKAVNPNLKVLISHQHKPFKPMHGYLDPRTALEWLVCKIADRMYNGDFIKMLTPHQEHFDGIALSIYSAVQFNLWAPVGSNCGANFSLDNAVECIMHMHNAFPNKEIWIVETGCNSTDPETKKAFIDMTLHACVIAREQGANVKGVYFWGQTNDPEYYSEWNMVPGSTNFGPFDKLDTTNPSGSINPAGLYLQEILNSK